MLTIPKLNLSNTQNKSIAVLTSGGDAPGFDDISRSVDPSACDPGLAGPLTVPMRLTTSPRRIAAPSIGAACAGAAVKHSS